MMMNGKVFEESPALASVWAQRMLSVLRIVVALGFLQHGTAKFFNFPPMSFPAPLPPIILAGGVLELVGGALLLLGIFTRPVAFVLSGEMAVAYFLFHAPQGFFPAVNGGEAAMLYCFVFLYLAFAGSGVWSLGSRCNAG